MGFANKALHSDAVNRARERSRYAELTITAMIANFTKPEKLITTE